MAGRLDRFPRFRTDRQVGDATVAALFWRLLLVNGLVFVAGATVLVLSPATVSAPASIPEIAVLALGLSVMLATTAVLLRATLKPLDGLTALMQRVDLLRPEQRLPVTGKGDIAHLIRTFNNMLDRLEAERGASTARALAAQEGERQRIAQELHDEIGQSLTAVLLGLKRAIGHAPEDVQGELLTVQEMVRASLDEVRHVARRLRPGVLDDLGLLSAISALATDLSEASRMPVTRRLDRQLPPLSRETELVIYRIAQESLTNVARHAGASLVELSLTAEENHVLLHITDDGHGMDGREEGAGIRGMRERALLVGADLTVGPRPSRGTEVRLIVPTNAGSTVNRDGTR
jgi:two-component system sensor histidine kinase UhpB